MDTAESRGDADEVYLVMLPARMTARDGWREQCFLDERGPNNAGGRISSSLPTSETLNMMLEKNARRQRLFSTFSLGAGLPGQATSRGPTVGSNVALDRKLNGQPESRG